jgi:hypothetical protein
MRDYTIAFDVDGDAWTETDQHESAEVAKAYAHVRTQMILAERRPRRTCATLLGDGETRLGAWTYDAGMDDAVRWTAES